MFFGAGFLLVLPGCLYTFLLKGRTAGALAARAVTARDGAEPGRHSSRGSAFNKFGTAAWLIFVLSAPVAVVLFFTVQYGPDYRNVFYRLAASYLVLMVWPLPLYLLASIDLMQVLNSDGELELMHKRTKLWSAGLVLLLPLTWAVVVIVAVCAGRLLPAALAACLIWALLCAVALLRWRRGVVQRKRHTSGVSLECNPGPCRPTTRGSTS